MSDRLVDALDFHGRLGRKGARRLSAKLVAVVIAACLAPLFLLMAGTSRLIACLPLSLLAVVAVANMAAGVRRMHDVGREARHEWMRALRAMTLVLAPLVVILAVPYLSPPVVLTLLGLSAAIFVAAVVRGRREWGPGETGPNRFGPAPE